MCVVRVGAHGVGTYLRGSHACIWRCALIQAPYPSTLPINSGTVHLARTPCLFSNTMHTHRRGPAWLVDGLVPGVDLVCCCHAACNATNQWDCNCNTLDQDIGTAGRRSTVNHFSRTTAPFCHCSSFLSSLLCIHMHALP